MDCNVVDCLGLSKDFRYRAWVRRVVGNGFLILRLGGPSGLERVVILGLDSASCWQGPFDIAPRLGKRFGKDFRYRAWVPRIVGKGCLILRLGGPSGLEMSCDIRTAGNQILELLRSQILGNPTSSLADGQT